MTTEIEDKYLKMLDGQVEDPELIPMQNIMTNDKFYSQFNGDTQAVYKYCIEKNITWEEALDFEYEHGMVY